MNVGIIILALMLAGASVFGIIMAASAHTTTYTDTYGNTTDTATNHTQGIVTNATGPAMSAGGGVVLLLAALMIVIVATVLISSAFGSSHHSTRK
jgi:hypothetical protein